MFDLKVINSVLSELEETRGISRAAIIEAIEAALATAYKKEYGKKGQIIRTTFDLNTGETQFYQVKIVVDESRVIFDKEAEILAEKGQTLSTDSQGLTLVHQTIKKVSEDIESMGFNTTVSSLMIFVNALDKQEKVSKEEFEILLILLAPFAPHITEELWSILGYKNSIHTQSWPTYDPDKIEMDEISLAVQINGKVRAHLYVTNGQSEEDVRMTVLALPEVKKWLNGKEPKKVIVVPRKIISIVT